MSFQHIAKKLNKINIPWKIKPIKHTHTHTHTHTHSSYMTVGSTRDPTVSSNCFEKS